MLPRIKLSFVKSARKCHQSRFLRSTKPLSRGFPVFHSSSDASENDQHEVHLLNISSGQSASLARVGGCFSTLLLCSSLPMHKKPGIGSEGKKIHSCNILPRGCEFSQCG